MSGRRRSHRLQATATVLGGVAIFASAAGLAARESPQQPAVIAPSCRLSGRITGVGAPLPGVSITARQGDSVHGVTSSAIDGTYRLAIPPGAYHLTIEMTGFDRIERDLTLEGTPCQQAVDLALALRPRGSTANVARGVGAARGGRAGAP